MQALFLLVLALATSVSLQHTYCSVTIVEQNKSVHVSLTSCVHSNVYGLGNIDCIRYLTAVDPFHPTSSAVYKYNHLTPGAVEVPV